MGRAGHLDRQHIPQRGILVSLRTVTRTGDHQEPAAPFLDKVGHMTQVALADLAILGIHVAPEHHIIAVQFLFGRKIGKSTLILAGVFAVGVQQQHLQIHRLVPLLAVAFALQQVLDEAVVITSVALHIQQVDQLGLANKDRALQAVVIGRLDLIGLDRHARPRRSFRPAPWVGA